MKTNYNKKLKFIHEKTSELIRYTQIYEILDDIIEQKKYTLLTDKQKKNLHQEDITFFDSYFPTLFELIGNTDKLNISQVKSIQGIGKQLNKIIG